MARGPDVDEENGTLVVLPGLHKQGTLALTKINVNDQGRVVRKIPLRDIESLFLRRPAGRGGYASLYVRLIGSDTPILALTGDTAELEVIHQHLCKTIQSGAHDAMAAPIGARTAFSRSSLSA